MEHRRRSVGGRARVAVLAVGLLVVGFTATSLPGTSALADGADDVDEISSNYGDDPGTAVWLHWRGPETVVSVGTDLSYGTDVTAQPSPVTPIDAPGPYWLAQVTGLAPGTVYHYRIGPAGADHTFETAPEGDFTWDDIGDTGSTFAAAGAPASCAHPWMTSFWQQLAADGADVYTHGGDVSYANNCGVGAAHQVFDDIAPVATTRPIEWSIGNHEYGNPAVDAPPGTPADVLNNYKGRWRMSHGQAVPTDTASATAHPGCSAAGVTGNACPGDDWGWFDVGSVRFISRPEPESGAYTDWQTKADAIMADAQADPTVTFVVTYGHRPACTSQKANGRFASSTEVMTAVNALGDRYSPAARPDGKYVLDVGHHIHIAEVCSPQHGVWELTDGGGGAEQPVVAATNPASLWKDNHFSYLRGRMVGGTLGLEFVCGPENTSAPTLAPACTQGDTLYSLSITSTPTPPPTTVEYVANPSVETDLTGWTGLFNKSSRSARVAGGFDGSFALRCWNGGSATATVGVVDKPHWVAGSTVAGRTYTASAWVSAQVSGERLSLVIKELTASKAVVGSSSVAATPAPGGWVRLSTTYTATAPGDSLAFYVTGAKVPAGQGFLVDLLGLTAPSP